MVDRSTSASPTTLPPQMRDMGRRSQLWPPVGLDLPRVVGWTARLFQPLIKGFGQRVRRAGPRGHQPSDILVPDGYVVDVVATGFSAPVMATFDAGGRCYVVESGHKVDEPPRIRRVDVHSGEMTTLYEFSGPDWISTGAVTGATWIDGSLYVTNTDRLFRIGPRGGRQTIVDGLPGRGDHQVNAPLLGPDRKLYIPVGTATNAGVVGADNYAYGWLADNPQVCDVPAQDVVLAGRNYTDRDVLGDLRNEVQTGVYVPFGTATEPGQVIRGSVKASGAILRCNPDGSDLEVVASGLRNPYGLAFAPDGRLYATEHGMDNRGHRHVVGDFDDLYLIEEGRWYGWPDFASGLRLDDPRWGDGGMGREPVLAEHPEADPPKPVVCFPPHCGSNGLAFSTGGSFGFEGQAFVALFGDLAPVTTPRLATPVGFRVVRVDVEAREIHDFAVNRVQGPASKLRHGGFERPSHCVFGPDGALYVTDFGEIDIAPEIAGIKVRAESGTLWRIRRVEGEAAGELPPKPRRVPFYLGQLAAWAGAAAGAAALAAAGALAVRRLLRRRGRE